jgi:hypothetical protein
MYAVFVSIPLEVRKRAIETICDNGWTLLDDGQFIDCSSRCDIDGETYCPLGVINYVAGVNRLLCSNSAGMPADGERAREYLAGVGISIDSGAAQKFINDVDNDVFDTIFDLAEAMGVEVTPAWFNQKVEQNRQRDREREFHV